jgi:hypothetical protein
MVIFRSEVGERDELYTAVFLPAGDAAIPKE